MSKARKPVTDQEIEEALANFDRRSLSHRLAADLRDIRRALAAWKALAKARDACMQAFDDENEVTRQAVAGLVALSIDPYAP